MEYTDELLSNLAPIAHKICIQRGYEIEYINPQKQDSDPVYVALRDGSKFIPTKDEILAAWEAVQAETIPDVEVLPVQEQIDTLNTRLQGIESQLSQIIALLPKG